MCASAHTSRGMGHFVYVLVLTQLTFVNTITCAKPYFDSFYCLIHFWV